MAPSSTRLPSPASAWMLASLGLHLVLAMWIVYLPPAAEMRLVAHAPDDPTPAPGAPSESVARGAAPGEVAPQPGGGLSPQNVDGPRLGEGGDATGAVEFVILVSRAHGVTLQDSPWNAPRVSQTQRIRTASDRASWEDRRATPSPDDDPFLASGEGRHRERRPLSERDARAGVRASSRPGAEGAARDVPTLALGDDERAASAREPSRAGGPRDAPSRGILTGRGARAAEAADGAHGRPPVDRGPAATLAEDRGRVRDDQDAELLAARLIESWVDASERRGRAPGPGRGGIGGGGAPGSSGSAGEGGRASPYGPGGGGPFALDTSDARYRRWYLAQRAKVEERLVFPRERALALDMGLTVYRLALRRDGSMASAPALVRGSGFPDLDRAAETAIRAAAPFDPLPPELARGDGVFSIDLTVRFANPLVH
ncbi:MAG: TonB C-terminal domain-containing protein [Myxococcales bacterium]|nr:TonB C-terminal domain-containing protein [Myxococcales bacterium]